jgi:hypothetical protein
MTFREFMADLPNDASPEFAKAEYDKYLAGFWGNESRAEFERKKDDPVLRRRFDPREIEKGIEKKKSSAQAAAAFLREHGLPSGVKVPIGPYHYAEKEDMDGLDDAGKPEDFRRAFPITSDQRAQCIDYKAARNLVRALDAECGILENPWKGEDIIEDGEPAGGDEKVTKISEDKEMPDGQAQNEEQEEEKMDTDVEAVEKYTVDEAFNVKQLDDLILYLWIVHGIDYYGCKEFGLEDDPARKFAKRTMRPAAEEKQDEEMKTEAKDGETEPDKTASDGKQSPKYSDADLKAYQGKVAQRWKNRISQGVPAARFLQASKVEEEISKFVDSQIIKHDDNKWGNKLSTKLFVAREFVVKHIMNKHKGVVEAHKAKLLDDIYLDNYMNSKEKDQKRQSHRGGRGGRGGRGMRGQMVYMDPSQMMGAPIIVPGGDGQNMAPVIMMPMGGRGGRGGRGRGFGGQQQGYFDLDAPKNNRAMLDYGDL